MKRTNETTYIARVDFQEGSILFICDIYSILDSRFCIFNFKSSGLVDLEKFSQAPLNTIKNDVWSYNAANRIIDKTIRDEKQWIIDTLKSEFGGNVIIYGD